MNVFELEGPITTAMVPSVRRAVAAARGPLRLIINSPGGSVPAGLEILGVLQGHKPGVACEIRGLAASMASVIACAGSPVLMAANAMLMIHNPWSSTTGDERTHRKVASNLEKIGDALRGIYVTKTGLADDEVRQMMDEETWLDAAEARRLKFVDQVTQASAAAPAALQAACARFPKLVAAMARRLPARASFDPAALFAAACARGDKAAAQTIFLRHKHRLFAARRDHHAL
jgi:ATP-dependent Clp endopeptidase proteolytic subunit ClpP